MQLYYRTLGEGDPLFIIHGLFGSSDNWQTLAKQFAEHFKVYLIDLRNHGKSPHDKVHTYESMANDLLEIVYEEQLTFLNLIGHSMGGKAAMKFAEMHGDFLDKLIIADIGPKEYKPHHDSILDALTSIKPGSVNSRKEADVILKKQIKEDGVRMFLLKNLYWKEKGVLDWKMNVPALEAAMPDILAKVPNDEVDVETLFLRGENSNYIQDIDFEEIMRLFPNSEVKTIPDAGHWLHAEQSQLFYDECMKFLDV